MSRKRKPKSPAQIAAEKAERLALQRAQDFAAVGLSPSASVLPANEDVTVTRAGPKSVESARRLDAFDALRDGMRPGTYDAARRLERDMRTRRGEQDRGRPTARVDHECDKDRTDRAVDAGRRVDRVLSRIGQRDAWLLSELIYPSGGRGWREVVAYVTGETHGHAQGAAVRSACENLRIAYESLERPAIERLDRPKILA